MKLINAQKIPLAGVTGAAGSSDPAADRGIGALGWARELLRMGASTGFAALGAGA